jgi:hypothetical protein
MHRLVVPFLLFLLADRSVATTTDLYQVTVVGNSPPGTDCANLGGSIGPTLMAKLETAAPWLQSYSPPVRRFLKVSNRKLATNYCSSSYCSRPANYQWCYYNGCKCTCGHRRMLYQGDGGLLDIQSGREQMEIALALAAAKVVGCRLGLVFNKITVDDSLL